MRLIAALRNAASDPAVLIECFIVANLAFLAVDIFVAHSMNGFAHWAEWIPFTFSLMAPALLVGCMFGAGQMRPPLANANTFPRRSKRASRAIGILVGLFSIAVGIAGLLWHLQSQFFAEQTLRNLVYAAPFVAPLAYSGLGFLILLNRMMPSQTEEWARWVVLLALGGWIGNFTLSLTDHAQNGFFYRPEWISVVASAVAIGGLTVAFADCRNRVFLSQCLALMGIEVVVGVAGWIFHLRAIANSPMEQLWDRVVYSAPAFAPLLFADLAFLGAIGLATLYARSGVVAAHTPA